MRYLVTATMAASVLAIGLRMDPAVALPLGGKAISPDTAIHNVQQQDKGQGPGARGGGDRERGDRDRGARDRDRPRSGRGGFGFEIGPGYFGYRPGDGCDWLRRRARDTDSPYWWRRYRACRGD